VVLAPAVNIKRRGTFLFRMKMDLMIDDEIPALVKDCLLTGAWKGPPGKVPQQNSRPPD
jgi:hypothetical protein